MTRPLIVAIDGPSGVGKSTVARRLASRLGLPFLDTGAMYRAVALAVLDAGVAVDDRHAVAAVAAAADVQLEPAADGRLEVRLAGLPVEERIRDSGISAATSVIAAYPEVRAKLVEIQRRTALAHGGVLEGRDIATHVVPETPFKFFVDARPEVRAARRHGQLLAAGKDASYADVVAELAERDWRDSHRSDAPLRCDDRYVAVDTSERSIDEVVAQMAATVQAHRAAD
jgi:cytidylate kinase